MKSKMQTFIVVAVATLGLTAIGYAVFTTLGFTENYAAGRKLGMFGSAYVLMLLYHVILVGIYTKLGLGKK